ncbi:hypothetical protein [Arthrobacter sp. Leaf69]|uniref:hypothetical protein n=1 Tax=Arthrobacter sp. Leaf69 TaxID=1736232 RepID=UPI000AADA1ED|nr:hypothetical protein [Arthrobacter sp. Leaf69]
MPDSAVIPATTTFRMTSLAWAVAVQGATETLEAGGPDLAGSGSGPAPAALADLAGLDEPTRSAIARELTTAGITDDAGTLRPQWLRALRQSAAAPIQVGLVSRWDGFSTHCRVNLFDGRGLAVEFTRPVDTSADGRVTAVSVADVVTVTLLSEAVLWPVMARSMPQFPELTAGAGRPDIVTGKSCPAPGRDGGKTTLSAADVAALSRGNTTGIAAGVAAAVSAANATVYLEVRSRAAGTGVQYHGAGVWALSDNLYSVRTTGPATARRLAMVDAPAGDIARQLVWHVLGAHDFLAGGTSAESAS